MAEKSEIALLGEKLDNLIALIARVVPAEPIAPDFDSADAFIWVAAERHLESVAHVNRVAMTLLQAVGRMRDTLLANTERFARGLPANNALLWGTRGMGKSSLVKASHAHVNEMVVKEGKAPLKLIEIHREDIESLPSLMNILRPAPYRFIIFCDDLSFDGDDASYKSLKAVLEGGIEGRPANVLFYATSNRRHLLPRDMMENDAQPPSTPARRLRKRFPSPTVSACGSASTSAARKNMSRWFRAM